MVARRRWHAVLVTLALLAGCSLFEKPPAIALDLHDTDWNVVEIDRIPLEQAATVHFHSAGDERATVETGCRTIVIGWILDTDGNAIGFDVQGVPVPPPCAGLTGQQDAALVSALETIGSWAITGQDRVELRDGHSIVLERIQTKLSFRGWAA